MTTEPDKTSRRIGERVVIEPIDVVWVLPPAKGVSRLRRKSPDLAGRVLEVSITGAAIEGPRHPELTRGTLAMVTFDGGQSMVRIRRIEVDDATDVLVYGVEHERLDDGLREAIFRAVGRGRPDEELWRRSY